MDDSKNNQIEHFQLRLAETIAWCSAQDWSFQHRPKVSPSARYFEASKQVWELITQMRPHDPQPLDFERLNELWALEAQMAMDIPPITGTGLRSEQLRPPPIEDNWGAIYHAGFPEAKKRDLLTMEEERVEYQWEQNVEQLAAIRAALLPVKSISPRDVVLPLDDERLLAYFREENLSDGAAEVASDGYFDSENVPPWDTWIVYVAEERLLLSFVPESLVEVVGEGIDANPEYCIGWATDFDTPYIRQLKQAGFLR